MVQYSSTKVIHVTWGISSAGSVSQQVNDTKCDLKLNKKSKPKPKQNQRFTEIWGRSSAGSQSEQLNDPERDFKLNKKSKPKP